MNALALLGVSHRRGGTRTLSDYAEAYAVRSVSDRLHAIGVHAFVEISTCNRLDVVLSRTDALRVEDVREALDVPAADRRPYVYSGEGAFEQLARIAASMDSMNPGEDQIMRQVRDAVMGARRRGEVDSTLSFALDAALRIARRVRRDVALAPRDTSLFSLVRPDLEELLRHRGGSMRALVVGAGEMARLCATLLKGLPGVELIIVNRTLSRAQALADALGGRAVAWSELASEVDGIDVLVSAIPGSPDVDWSPFVGLGGVSLMVDLGLPSALGGSWAQGLGGRLVDIHALEVLGAQRRHELEGRLSEAERVLRLALDEELGEWAERTLSPSIQRLLALYEAALGDVLPDAQARSLARRLANIPIRGLRALAREHGVEAARTFAFESGLELPHGLQP